MGMKMDGDIVLMDCILCSQYFLFGNHRFAGRYVPEWNAYVCDRCIAANQDGVMTETHPQLVKHLKELRVSVQLNAKGWLDIPPS
jgi:hypothetical protein